MNYIEQNERLDFTDDYIINLPTQYAKKFCEAHSDYWEKEYKTLGMKSAENVNMSDNAVEMLRELLTVEKKGCTYMGQRAVSKPQLHAYWPR